MSKLDARHRDKARLYRLAAFDPREHDITPDDGVPTLGLRYYDPDIHAARRVFGRRLHGNVPLDRFKLLRLFLESLSDSTGRHKSGHDNQVGQRATSA